MTPVELLGLACALSPLALVAVGMLAVGVWLVRDQDRFDEGES